jgi:hypothetical protein
LSLGIGGASGSGATRLSYALNRELTVWRPDGNRNGLSLFRCRSQCPGRQSIARSLNDNRVLRAIDSHIRNAANFVDLVRNSLNQLAIVQLLEDDRVLTGG